VNAVMNLRVLAPRSYIHRRHSIWPYFWIYRSLSAWT
jgi:hypothetical protein